MPLPSETSVIYDTVTLHHFAAADRFDILRELHMHRPIPRWVASGKNEVEDGLNHIDSRQRSQLILAQTWFDVPGDADAAETLELQIAISEPGELQKYKKKNLGEAEAIVLAKATGAILVTDDNGAYDFASKAQQLGPGRVFDACQLLDQAVIDGYIVDGVRWDVHRAVRDANREMHCKCKF
ncbi:hypothetical protein BJK06_08220 [Curtobacterium sp. BH-2-1-1]|uniref:hypothetical protein n=1 Tax=Curtobacterium sp. BH-2-1-1 TaxID=1905847 RepID=UPI00089DEE69|nr:hypothetical protein [Curtobacterium sp. BH-2-1-1]AOX65737.1 hypothetical protein BJK06_08220 [Curtobacterium sp. BH-2-1-1]